MDAMADSLNWSGFLPRRGASGGGQGRGAQRNGPQQNGMGETGHKTG